MSSTFPHLEIFRRLHSLVRPSGGSLALCHPGKFSITVSLPPCNVVKEGLKVTSFPTTPVELTWSTCRQKCH